MQQHRSISYWLTRLSAFVVLALVSAGCLYTPSAVRTTTASGGAEIPWFCDGAPAISTADCYSRSIQFDTLLIRAHQYLTVSAVTTAGGTPLASTPTGVGSAYVVPGSPTTFNGSVAQVLLYTGSAPTSRLAGVAHVVTTGAGNGPPAGYTGDQDVWTEIDATTGTWMLPVWIVRGYLNHPNVFAATHPCLATGATLTATTDACFLASHTRPLEVLVTNDDGIGAPGIDALVEGLRTVPGLHLTVIAPLLNQSGTGDTTSPPADVTSVAATTASGFPSLAVKLISTGASATPGDSVLYALNVQHADPDLVISGINNGQNMGPVIAASGTVGAARIAARSGVPAVATSQGGIIVTPDFPAGTTATLAWLEQFRLGLAGPPFMQVANINIPSCAPGTSVRGTINTVVATVVNPVPGYLSQDCASTVTAIPNDIAAFNYGFVGVADAKLR